ncbi:unnamed protein product [Oikopleura dioica]|uniref:Uncharacterized protein n=1 Tax=Oikopleura dioica TaxID=34765 RepID=E4Z147_OIKDI|nr:unnamed protein product [Oikopleura dioica]
MRDMLAQANDFDEIGRVAEEAKRRLENLDENNEYTSPQIMDDLLMLPYWRCKPYVRPKPSETTENNSRKRNSGMIEENLKRKKHKEQKKAKYQEKMAKEGVRPKYEMCIKCPGNPRGLKCTFLFCKACCRKRLSMMIQIASVTEYTAKHHEKLI